MRAMVYHGPGHATLTDVPDPELTREADANPETFGLAMRLGGRERELPTSAPGRTRAVL
jgi:hypothetical protein